MLTTPSTTNLTAGFQASESSSISLVWCCCMHVVAAQGHYFHACSTWVQVQQVLYSTRGAAACTLAAQGHCFHALLTGMQFWCLAAAALQDVKLFPSSA
jgi:hypothetical protein